jgi:hypothetical protein
MLRKAALSTSEQLHAANAEVSRLQDKLKQEAVSAPESTRIASKTQVNKDTQSSSLILASLLHLQDKPRNSLRHALFITAAFAGQTPPSPPTLPASFPLLCFDLPTRVQCFG